MEMRTSAMEAIQTMLITIENDQRTELDCENSYY